MIIDMLEKITQNNFNLFGKYYDMLYQNKDYGQNNILSLRNRQIDRNIKVLVTDQYLK